MVTGSWNKVCKPLEEGGLGLSNLITLNEAANLKLCWEMLNSQKPWAILLKNRACINGNPVRCHIFSSIWSSIKIEHSIILEYSSWNIGNGELVNFWNDRWCGQPLAITLNMPTSLSHQLNAKVCDFIDDFQWIFPISFQIMFPAVRQLAHQVIIPKVHIEDSLVWNNSSSGDLTFKEAYLFKSPAGQNLHWAKIIWSPDIPPSKSLLVWRVMHDRLRTDENLMIRGCNLASLCNNCFMHSESTFHLFFQCPFAVKIWSWFANVLNTTLQFSTIDDIWKICDKNWSLQCLVVIKACIINIFSTIWFVRNQARFQNKKISWNIAINNLISNV